MMKPLDTNAIFLERAKPEYLQRLNEISWAAKGYWGYPDEWMQRWKNDLMITSEHLEAHHIFIIRIEKLIAGFCMIIKENTYYEIEHLWIDPAYIGKGLGKRLLVESIQRVIPIGAEIYVLADPNAEKFYQKMGFETFEQFESVPKGRFLPKMKTIREK